MHIKELLDEWEASSHGHEAPISMTVNLPLEAAARILALNELYPERTKEQIFIELLHVALNGLEEAFPYVQGEKIIAEDEFGDPIYEDAGLTPRFMELTRKYQEQLKAQQKKKAKVKI
ncbi:MAG: hypothetical protein ACWGOW_06515 [Gammaproteobacteria bacterium]